MIEEITEEIIKETIEETTEEEMIIETTEDKDLKDQDLKELKTK